MTLAPELARLNQILEDAARRDLAGTRRWRRVASTLSRCPRRASAVVSVALLVAAGGIAFGVSRAIDTPPRQVVDAASGIGARRPLPRDAIHLGGYTVWLLAGGKGPAVSIVRDDRATMPLSVGCSPYTRATPISVCGGIQERGEPAVVVGRVSAAVASIEAGFSGGREGRVSLGHGVFVVEGPEAGGSERLGPRPTRIVARGPNGRITATVRP